MVRLKRLQRKNIPLVVRGMFLSMNFYQLFNICPQRIDQCVNIRAGVLRTEADADGGFDLGGGKSERGKRRADRMRMGGAC